MQASRWPYLFPVMIHIQAACWYVYVPLLADAQDGANFTVVNLCFGYIEVTVCVCI